MASESQITESDLAGLIGRMDEPADAYIRGDIHRYLSIFDHPDDYTLMPPYGGETTHGFDHTEQGAAETSRFFASGEASLDLQQSFVSGDLAVLVAVERQHGEVGGLPDQDWSLRVTLVFRRTGDRWQIAHPPRGPTGEADPLRTLRATRPWLRRLSRPSAVRRGPGASWRRHRRFGPRALTHRPDLPR